MKKQRENQDFFKALPEKIIEKAKQALAKGADEIVSDAKTRCPVKTGKLRDSIHAEKQKDGMKYKIVADAKSEKGKNEFYGKVVEYRPGGQPFIYPAIDANRKDIVDSIGNAISEACELKS